ncbi:MAG: HD domain-containing protein [Alphaproteobacteria bacterium]|nr:HD domain-containing protein [Alphaproteobacteria bacterium]
MIHDELIFLKKEYRKAYEQTVGDELITSLINRKFVHSWRVFQNGMKIVKSDLKDTDARFLDMSAKALIFHDIGRFSEAVNIHNNRRLGELGQKYDHGQMGAEILSSVKKYNDLKILLAVRHHGHIMEDFYNDSQYIALAEEDKKCTETLLKLVRDADKLDLYHLQIVNASIENDVFFNSLSEDLKYCGVSDEVLKQFFCAKTILHSTIKNLPERILGCVSWQFDLNYPLTRKLYINNNYREVLLGLFDKYCTDKHLTEEITQFARKSLD